MSKLGSTTILGDLRVTGSLIAENVGGNFLPLTGGTLTGDLSLINSYPCITMQQNSAKTRLITDNNHFWIEGTSSGSTPTSRLSFNLTSGELYIGNANSRVYHENYKPNNLASEGAHTAETGAAYPAKTGLTMGEIYNNGYAYNYGNVLTLYGRGCSQLAMHWSGTSGAQANMYYRSKRDMATANWSNWAKILMTSADKVAGQFFDGTTAPTSTTRLNYDGYLYATRTYNAVWNDYAEYFKKLNVDEVIEPGDVIVVDKEQELYTKSKEANSNCVIGVVSDSYGHIVGGTGNDEIDNKEYIPVGLSGRVNVKIIGKINVGDLITTSHIEGVAMKAINPQLGTIIGKAVESKNTEEIGKIKMFILNT